MNIFKNFLYNRLPEQTKLPTRVDDKGYEWIDGDFFGFGDFSKSKDNLSLQLPTAKEYLETCGNHYPWQEKWLLEGKVFPSPSREDCLRIRRAKAHVNGNCYINALEMALGQNGRIVQRKKPREILYCEGIAVNPVGGHLHAWLVVDGKVYDPTWPDAYRASFFGITFEPSFILEFAERTNRVSLLQNWHKAQKVL